MVVAEWIKSNCDFVTAFQERGRGKNGTAGKIKGFVTALDWA